MTTIIPLAILFGLLRIVIGVTVEIEPITWVGAYKAFAHIFMGYLLALAIYDRSPGWWAIFWLMCLLEVVVAVLARMS